MTALPAHWATREGIDGGTRTAFREGAQRVASDPVHERRARQKKAALAVTAEAAARGAFAVDAAAGRIGLVKHSTSQTQASLDAVRGELESDSSFFEMTQHEARLGRMTRGVRSACKVHHFCSRDWAPAMFTLTHAKGEAPEKKDISKFIDALKKWMARKWKVKSMRYVWVAELQEDRARLGDSGAVHYHVCVWMPPELKRIANSKPWLRGDGSWALPKPDKKGWWKNGSSRAEWVKKSVRSYLEKYISKGSESTWFPKGLRLHGAGGFDRVERGVRSYNILPSWLRSQVHPEDRCARAPGGGWVSRLTGERFASPYFVIATGRVIKIVRITECNAKTVQRYCELAVQKAMASISTSQWMGSVSVSA